MPTSTDSTSADTNRCVAEVTSTLPGRALPCMRAATLTVSPIAVYSFAVSVPLTDHVFVAAADLDADVAYSRAKQYNSRSFFIQGAVRNPGVYQSEGKPSLLELITLASGLSETHGSTAFIIRRVKLPVPTPPQPINGAVASRRGSGKQRCAEV